MVTVAIDVSDARVLLEKAKREGGGRLRGLWEWARAYPSAVGIIERDLDSLLRFYRCEQKYRPRLRTTNPSERLNQQFTGREHNAYRLLAYVALTINLGWRSYVLSHPKPLYTLKAA